MKRVCVAAMFLVTMTGSALAECYVIRKGGSMEVIGRFPFAIATKACVNTYIRMINRDRSLNGSRLYIRCSDDRYLGRVVRRQVRLTASAYKECT